MNPAVAVTLLTAISAAFAVPQALEGSRRRKRKAEALRAVDIPGTQKDASLLRALGHDPETSRILPLVRGRTRGLRIVDLGGQPLAFYTEKQLRTPEVRQRWQRLMRTTQVKA